MPAVLRRAKNRIGSVLVTVHDTSPRTICHVASGSLLRFRSGCPTHAKSPALIKQLIEKYTAIVKERRIGSQSQGLRL
jgi:hypothetical protein